LKEEKLLRCSIFVFRRRSFVLLLKWFGRFFSVCPPNVYQFLEALRCHYYDQSSNAISSTEIFFSITAKLCGFQETIVKFRDLYERVLTLCQYRFHQHYFMSAIFDRIGGFNLEYGNLENCDLESRNGYLEFNLENGILAFPIIIPHPHPTPHTHLQTPHAHMPHPLTPGGWSWGAHQGFFEIKFEITVFKKEVLRKVVWRFEKSVFEINDFSPFFIRKCFAQLFSNQSLALIFLAKEYQRKSCS
jgi:hypothetical protein